MKKKVIAPIGVRAIGAGGCNNNPPPPQILGNSDILGIAAREIWAKPIFTKLCMFGFFFPLKELFFILSLSRRCKGSYIGR